MTIREIRKNSIDMVAIDDEEKVPSYHDVPFGWNGKVIYIPARQLGLSDMSLQWLASKIPVLIVSEKERFLIGTVQPHGFAEVGYTITIDKHDIFTGEMEVTFEY